MAGAGYKLFATGDVLTAAEVNTYLQQQVTMVFADSSARTTALSGVLAEGMMSYLQDSNTVEVYNGSNWVNVGNTGDVTEVQAGTGISVADGTGPIPIVTNTMATEIDAKGDLIVGTGDNTFDRLAVGTDGFTLVADSSTATGLAYAAPAGGGKVLQVVSAVTTTSTTISTATMTDTTITATITPSAATSKILVLVSAKVWSTGQNATSVEWNLVRGATDILTRDNDGAQMWYASSSVNTVEYITNPSIIYLDSPNTTSATTYKVQASTGVTGSSLSTIFQRNSDEGTITLLEIGA